MRKFDRLKVAVTSRALFDLSDSDRIYHTKPLRKFISFQEKRERRKLKEGPAFSLVKGLLKLRHPKSHEYLADVYLISKNDPSTGFRICNSIEKYKLRIERLIFTGGEPHHAYIQELGIHLFMSADEKDVRDALSDMVPSARVLEGFNVYETTKQIRFAFDGDAVIFSDEAEKVYKRKGLLAFRRNETLKRNTPIGAGPFQKLLARIHEIQKLYPWEHNPIRTALFTARDNYAYKRAINTLRKWNIRLNEAFFLGGLDKSGFLKIYKPHIFFEDQKKYCLNASKKVAVAHVPYGVRNARGGRKARKKRRL